MSFVASEELFIYFAYFLFGQPVKAGFSKNSECFASSQFFLFVEVVATLTTDVVESAC